MGYLLSHKTHGYSVCPLRVSSIKKQKDQCDDEGKAGGKSGQLFFFFSPFSIVSVIVARMWTKGRAGQRREREGR